MCGSLCHGLTIFLVLLCLSSGREVAVTVEDDQLDEDEEKKRESHGTEKKKCIT